MPELLQEWADVIARALMAEGMPRAQADRVAFVCVRDLAVTYGGEQIYFPRAWSLQLSSRDEAIYRAYVDAGGGPAAAKAVARQHKLSERHVQRIVAAAQAAETDPAAQTL
jgi:Mor family transcriptional regulator